MRSVNFIFLTVSNYTDRNCHDPRRSDQDIPVRDFAGTFCVMDREKYSDKPSSFDGEGDKAPVPSQTEKATFGELL
jgi:hypothetical protein